MKTSKNGKMEGEFQSPIYENKVIETLIFTSRVKLRF